MAAELLDPYFIKPCFRRVCALSVPTLGVHLELKETLSLLKSDPESAEDSFSTASTSVAYPRHCLEERDDS